MAYVEEFKPSETVMNSATAKSLDSSPIETPQPRRGSHVVEVIETPSATLHPSDNLLRHASVSHPDFGGLTVDSRDATLYETNMSVGTALKTYRRAVLWSVLLSMAIVMEGYDIVLVSNLYGLPSFNNQFGNAIDPQTGKPTITASWRSGIGNGALVGQVVGLLITGIVQERYGYKKTISCALFGLIGFISLTFFAQNLLMLLIGEILCGLSWGVFQTITTAYASEVTPVVLRGYLTAYVNFCWVFGQLIASGVLRGMLNLKHSQWGWRIPFGLQWAWPMWILGVSILCPESPWWLVRRGRVAEAKTNLLRLVTPESDGRFNADKTIAMMLHTNEIEKEMSQSTTYLQCFRGFDLRRTELTCGSWLLQTLSGALLMGYSTVFFQQAGLSVKSSFNLSVGQYAIGMVGTVGSWLLMSRFGRRTLYLTGASTLCIVLFVTGFLGIRADETAAQWAIGSMLLIYALAYNLTVGPVCYSLVSELPSTRLKAKTMVLARCSYNVITIPVIVIINYQLTPTAWAWGAYSAFFWSGSCFLCVLWIYFRLPEPKNRTYGELDILFENRIPAREFKKKDVDIFRGYKVAVVDSDEFGGPRKESLAEFKQE